MHFESLMENTEDLYQKIAVLERKEAQLKLIIEASKIGIWDFTPEKDELNLSEEAIKIYGIPNNKYIFSDFINLTKPTYINELNAEIDKALTAEKSDLYECTYKIIRPSDGQERWLKVKLKFENKVLTGLVTDITEGKNTYEDLLKSENIFKSIALNIPNSLILVIDKEHRFLAVEGDLMQKMGYESKNYEGKHPIEVSPPERYEATKHLYERVLGGEKFSEERKSQAGDNYMVHFVPLKNSLDEIYAGLIIALDINQIKKSEEYSARLATIIQSADDAIISKSLDSIITSWNPAAERIFGYKSEEVIGQPITILIPEERLNEENEILNKLKRGELIEQFKTERLTKDHRLIDISLTISPIRDSQNRIIGVSKIARDISAERKSKEIIKQREEQLSLALVAADLGTFDLDLVSGTMDWDDRCRELFGIYNKDAVSYDYNFLNGLHEEDRDVIDQTIKRLYKGDNDGNYDVEYRTIGLEDKKLRWVRAKGKVFFNENKIPTRFIGAVLDITDKKLEELKKADFVAIVSHELKTPLTSIKSYIQLLLVKSKKKDDHFTINALGKAEIQVNKMAFMINDFLSLARIEEGKINLHKKYFELHHLMQEIVNDAVFINSTHKFKLLDCDDILIYADQDKIAQVLENLISNAIKYSPKKELITIGCVKEGNKVKIFVEDHGVGINAIDQGKLFDRFYRVENDRMKNVSGFGIGLYLVSEILKYHKSKIELKSEEGEGSTFYFYLDFYHKST